MNKALDLLDETARTTKSPRMAEATMRVKASIENAKKRAGDFCATDEEYLERELDTYGDDT